MLSISKNFFYWKLGGHKMDLSGVLCIARWVFYSPVLKSDKQCWGIVSLSCRDSRGGPGIPSFVLGSDDCEDY